MIYTSDTFKPYSELITMLVALRKHDFVVINFDLAHRELVESLCEVCYSMGAKYVDLNVQSAIEHYSRAHFLNPKHSNFLPAYSISKYKEYLENDTCVISIRSPQSKAHERNINQDNLSKLMQNKRKALSFFSREILQDTFTWIVCACPTTEWAHNLFPDLSPKEGYKKLWTILQSILRLDHDDPGAIWKKQQENLIKRKKNLNAKQYQELHFVSEHTDLWVSLSPMSTWLGGAHTSKNNRYFQANVPTEEVYTTPDCRKVRGKVTVTRELEVLGMTVSGITFWFENGKIVDFKAKKGQNALENFFAADIRNSYMGEIALVDCDSPVWKSGLVFNNILLDENSGVHFALGSAYPSGYGIHDTSAYSSKSLLEIGCNVSENHFHIDFTFGSEDLTVYGISSNSEEAIILDGKFVL